MHNWSLAGRIDVESTIFYKPGCDEECAPHCCCEIAGKPYPYPARRSRRVKGLQVSWETNGERRGAKRVDFG